MGFFCFAHLRWCHNEWVSNTLIVVVDAPLKILDAHASIMTHQRWEEQKKSHLLFSK